MTSPSADGLLELAVTVAEEAGRTLRGFGDRHAAGEDLGVTSKTSVTDPVSEADEAAERLIAERLLSACPTTGSSARRGRPTAAGPAADAGWSIRSTAP
jgi:myo-inositol-1(or 4)-monophosphatase